MALATMLISRLSVTGSAARCKASRLAATLPIDESVTPSMPLPHDVTTPGQEAST